jgi:hypothetical protein
VKGALPAGLVPLATDTQGGRVVIGIDDMRLAASGRTQLDGLAFCIH